MLLHIKYVLGQTMMAWMVETTLFDHPTWFRLSSFVYPSLTYGEMAYVRYSHAKKNATQRAMIGKWGMI